MNGRRFGFDFGRGTSPPPPRCFRRGLVDDAHVELQFAAVLQCRPPVTLDGTLEVSRIHRRAYQQHRRADLIGLVRGAQFHPETGR